MEELLSKYSFADIIFIRGRTGDDKYKIYITSLKDMKKDIYYEIYDMSHNCKTYLQDRVDISRNIEDAFAEFMNITLSIMIEKTPIEERYHCIKLINTTLGICITYEDKYTSGIDFKLTNSCKYFLYHGLRISSNLTTLTKSKRKELLKEFSNMIYCAYSYLIHEKNNMTGIICLSESFYDNTNNIDHINLNLHVPVNGQIGLHKLKYYSSMNTEYYLEYLNKFNLNEYYKKYAPKMQWELLEECCEKLFTILEDRISMELDGYIEPDDPLAIISSLLNNIITYLITKDDRNLDRKEIEILLKKMLYVLEPKEAVYIDLFFRKFILSKKDKDKE